MSETPGVPTHSTNVLRNIIVGVTTTVLGSSAVYFLGFHNRSGEHYSSNDFLVTKEATTNAWKSYETFENAYTKNSLSLMKDIPNLGLDEFMKQTKEESVKFQKSIETLAKKDDIDKDMVTALNRRLDNEKNSMPKVENYIDAIKKIVNSTMTEQEKKSALTNEDAKWAATSNGMFERSVTDIEEIAKTLSERYGQRFSMNDFLVMQLRNQSKKTADSLANLNRSNLNNTNTNITNPGKPTDPNNNNINNNNVSNNGNNNINNKYSGVTIDGRILPGNWSTPGAEIELTQNGKFYWDVLSTGQSSSGTWQFYNNQLYMYTSNPANGSPVTWVFNLSDVTKNSFTMQLAVSPYNMYSLVRNMNDY